MVIAGSCYLPFGTTAALMPAVSSTLLCGPSNDRFQPPDGGGSLPPETPPGGGSRGGGSPLGQLIQSLGQAAATVRVPTLATALTHVVEAYDAIRSRPAGPASEDLPQLDSMTASLARFTGRDMGLVAPTSWPLVASALYAAGLLVLLRYENSQSMPLTSELFQSIASFEKETLATSESGEARRAVAPEELFLCDRYLGDTLLSLKGCFQPGTLDFASEISLGRILARLGIASGVQKWPQRDVDFPNLTGAVWTFFDGGSPSLFQGVALLEPHVYFQTAAGWRVNSLGSLETVLSSVLDGVSKSHLLRVLNDSAKLFPNDDTLRRLQKTLSAASSRGAALDALFDALETWFGGLAADGSAEVSLPLFLQAARTVLH